MNLDENRRIIQKPWGREEHLTPKDSDYVLKILYIDEGAQLSIQSHIPEGSHPAKTETWRLLEGVVSAKVGRDPNKLSKEIALEEGVGYTVKSGLWHTLIGGKGGGAVIEASTPESGITKRHSDIYGRAGVDEDSSQRQLRDQGLL